MNSEDMFPLVSDIPFLITLGAIIPSAILGILVYTRGEQGLSKGVFLFASLSIIFWSIINYSSLQVSPYTLFWVRLVLFSAVFQVYSFFLFVHIFAEDYSHFSRIQLWGLTLLGVITMAATQTPLVFKEIVFEGGQPIPVPGPLIPLFALTIFSFFILGMAELIRKLRESVGIRRVQLAYIAIGYSIMFVLLIFTQFIFAAILKNTYFIQFGPLFTLPFLFLTTIAIFRHHLFNIRVIATELFTVIIVTIFLINVLLSDDTQAFIRNNALFVATTIFGVLLIRGTLRELNELQKISEAKTEFISIVSHQLRTPLTAIKGYISMLLEGSYGKLPDDTKEPLSSVYQSNERLIKLIEDFLDISKIELGRYEFSFQDVDVDELVQEIVNTMKGVLMGKNLSLSFEKAGAAHFIISGDELKLRQVFLNLIDNAIRYTPQGHIFVRCEKRNEHTVRISVRDTGIGLESHRLPLLFERFSRGTNKINTEGTGLGLYIAKIIVDAHHGKIWAESEGLDKGSTFSVELPLKQ